jgi:predicted PurR-regulated permease PerM
MSVASRHNVPSTLTVAGRLASFAIVCSLLYFGQVVLIPLALAALVAFLLSPLVTRVDRLGLPRVAAVLIVAGAATGILGGIGWVVVGQLGEFANELPAYRSNIKAKIADLRAMTHGGTLEKVQSTIEDLGQDIERSTSPQPQAPASSAPKQDAPVPVQISPRGGLLGGAELLGPVLEGAATAGLVMLLSVFMLIKREDLRDRIVSLAGHASLVNATKASVEVGERISRFLLMQFIINATMGIAVWVGLYFIGVPYSALWGLGAAILRYVPYLGPFVAAALPIMVSLVTSPGWHQPLLVLGMFIVYELLSNNVMEPLLYGHSVGLSAIAIIISAIFWTWLWGPVGLVLATPLTACLVVLSRYVPELAVIDRLLGERPVFDPEQTLYQRLLAQDEDEAEEILDAYLENHSIAETCDDLLLRSLLMLKRDLARGSIDAGGAEYVTAALREMIDDLPLPAAAPETKACTEPPVSIVGFPVRDGLDEVALELLHVLLREVHCELRILSSDKLTGERVAQVEELIPAAVCIASLSPGDLTATRYVVKRLRSRMPDVMLVIGRLGAESTSERGHQLLKAAGVKHIAVTLQELRADLLPAVNAYRSVAPEREAETGSDALSESESVSQSASDSNPDPSIESAVRA